MIAWDPADARPVERADALHGLTPGLIHGQQLPGIEQLRGDLAHIGMKPPGSVEEESLVVTDGGPVLQQVANRVSTALILPAGCEPFSG